MSYLPLLALLLATTTAPASPLGLGELPQQSLAKGSCALFLWDRASRQRVVMVTAAPARIMVMRGGQPVLLGLSGSTGAAVLGFAPHASYGEGTAQITIDLAVLPAEGGGGIVRDGAITVTTGDGSSVVAPVAGIIGCS
jgi:hypothetical protein